MKYTAEHFVDAVIVSKDGELHKVFPRDGSTFLGQRYRDRPKKFDAWKAEVLAQGATVNECVYD